MAGFTREESIINRKMGRYKEFYDWVKKDPKNFKLWLLRSFSALYDDETYIKKIYEISFGKYPNLKAPQTFNEKLNWLKLNYRIDQLTIMADKYAVKSYVAGLIGKEYVVENYGVWNRWEDIDFSSLPNEFVLKGTHDSGGAFVCRDKKTFDFQRAEKKLRNNLNRNFYYSGREWPYKNIPHRIIADRLLDDHTGTELRDYKFWCFNGKPTYMYCTIKGKNVYENFYDMDFKAVMINHGFPRHQPEFEKPSQFELMKGLAEKLSSGLPFVRVDFFQVEEKVYFGEFTFYDWGGLRPFVGDWDAKLGGLLNLPRV